MASLQRPVLGIIGDTETVKVVGTLSNFIVIDFIQAFFSVRVWSVVFRDFLQGSRPFDLIEAKGKKSKWGGHVLLG